MDFRFVPQKISDVLLVEHGRVGDERGFFSEIFRADIFAAEGIPPFVQDNYSRSQKGVLRGIHFQQNPHAVGKLVRCTQGEIFDVAVDLRRGSPTFGEWTGVILNAETAAMLYLPPGFGHGFCTLSESADVHYKMTGYYAPESEGAIYWKDSDLGIAWPIEKPIISQKDKAASSFQDVELNFEYSEYKVDIK